MSKNTYSVYCHTNKFNGKKYIGITRRKPELRWKKGSDYKHNPYFYNSIYGIINLLRVPIVIQLRYLF